jgi:hypothetical protein
MSPGARIQAGRGYHRGGVLTPAYGGKYIAAMRTWAELQSYARGKYRLSEDVEDRFALIFAIPGGRTQQVVVTRFAALERDFIEFRTPVCREDQLAPRAALLHNATFGEHHHSILGSLALHEGVYYLVHRALLGTLDSEEFELPLHAMALHADTLEARHTQNLDAY